jgi:hypothetical protein
VVTCIARLVIPNECEGSKNDLSPWSRQGFLPEFTLSFAEGVDTTSVSRTRRFCMTTSVYLTGKGGLELIER